MYFLGALCIASGLMALSKSVCTNFACPQSPSPDHKVSMTHSPRYKVRTCNSEPPMLGSNLLSHGKSCQPQTPASKLCTAWIPGKNNLSIATSSTYGCYPPGFCAAVFRPQNILEPSEPEVAGKVQDLEIGPHHEAGDNSSAMGRGAH